MYEYLYEAFSVSSATLTVVGLLCAVALLAVKEKLPHPPVAYIAYPIACGAALLILQACNAYELYAPQVLQQWLLFTVLSATLGASLTLLAYILVARVLGSRAGDRQTIGQVRHVRLGN